ncbi:MAG: hypothetical protein Q9221_009053 [Calogaya cf. arnoldii]
MGREEQTPSQEDEDKHPSILQRPAIARRLSGELVPGLPGPPTFRRQNAEKREPLKLGEPTITERRAASVGRREGKAISTTEDRELSNFFTVLRDLLSSSTDQGSHSDRITDTNNPEDTSGTHLPSNEHTRASLPPGNHPRNLSTKIKRGLPGFVNGARVSALPDTGSSRNVVSLAFAQEMKIGIHGSPADFKLGNSTYTKSVGTVTLDWAFSDNPQHLFKIICDVLPEWNYSMILGSRFLTATQTLSKFRRRLTECLFSTFNVLKMNFLGCDNTRIHGYVGDYYGEELIEVAAIPDTGADGNIRIENVVLGDTVLYDYNVFEDHAASISSYESQYDIQQLAPFDFVKKWQRHFASLLHRPRDRMKDTIEVPPADQSGIEEAERQEAWDYQYSFGETATEAEKAAEKTRRDLRSLSTSSASPGAQAQGPGTISVPSMATAPNSFRQASSRTSNHP